MYPTSVKGLGVGFTNFLGKFGCATSPMITYVAVKVGIHPMILYGLIALVGAYAAF